MEQICLDDHTPLKKTGHTSKGDQLKWKIGNIRYKADYYPLEIQQRVEQVVRWQMHRYAYLMDE